MILCLYMILKIIDNAIVSAQKLFEVAAVGYVADGGYDLQLRRTFVDARDAGIAIEALDGIIEHKT